MVEGLEGGATWVVDVDLESCFDREVLKLLRAYLSQGVMDGLEQWQPEAGTPQGAVMSPLLANIYLAPLDKHMAEQGYRMVRYADDMVVLCRKPEGGGSGPGGALGGG